MMIKTIVTIYQNCISILHLGAQFLKMSSKSVLNYKRLESPIEYVKKCLNILHQPKQNQPKISENKEQHVIK